MDYQQLFYAVKALMKKEGGIDQQLGISLVKHAFTSAGSRLLPGKEQYICPQHLCPFEQPEEPASEYDLHPLKLKDIAIVENKYFDYYIMQPLGNPENSRGVILLFHGLNEKSWDKYLPWAASLVQRTGKSVILFPIAFHMNRAPKSWSDIKSMHQVAQYRQQKHPGYSNISAVNTAISIRLCSQPDRLFWSGLQTYQDLSVLIKKIKRGQIPHVSPDSTIDFFSYSIGAFLSIILLMANPKDYFKDTRLFAFCGGATLDRTYPISKYILDSNGGQRLNSYFSEQLHNHFQASPRLAHYMETHQGENFFKLMLHYNHYKQERENKMAGLHAKIMAVPLKKDQVVPPVEVLSTLKGDYRDIPTRVEPVDFDFPYDHVHPFSLMEKYRQPTDEAFNLVMNKAAAFLR